MELGELLTQLILIGFGAIIGFFGSIVAQIFPRWYEERRIKNLKRKYRKSIDSVLYDLYKSRIYLPKNGWIETNKMYGHTAIYHETSEYYKLLDKCIQNAKWDLFEHTLLLLDNRITWLKKEEQKKKG